jgi:hypothetical protein
VVGIAIEWTETSILMRAYVANALSEDEHEALDIALTEILSDFPTVTNVELVLVDWPGGVLRGPGDWVFLRYGA